MHAWSARACPRILSLFSFLWAEHETIVWREVDTKTESVVMNPFYLLSKSHYSCHIFYIAMPITMAHDENVSPKEDKSPDWLLQVGKGKWVGCDYAQKHQ